MTNLYYNYDNEFGIGKSAPTLTRNDGGLGYNSLMDKHLEGFYSSPQAMERLRSAGLIDNTGRVVGLADMETPATSTASLTSLSTAVKTYKKDRKSNKKLRPNSAPNRPKSATAPSRRTRTRPESAGGALSTRSQRNKSLVRPSVSAMNPYESFERPSSTTRPQSARPMTPRNEYSPRRRTNDRPVSAPNQRPESARRMMAGTTIRKTGHLSSSSSRLSMYGTDPDVPPHAAGRYTPLCATAPRSKAQYLESVLTLQYVGRKGYGNSGRKLSRPRIESGSERPPVFGFVQHRPGAALLKIYEGPLYVGEVFSLLSVRSSNEPFGVVVYKDGILLERLTACCEYKYRQGCRLGGSSGSFKLVCVARGSRCNQCLSDRLMNRPADPFSSTLDLLSEDGASDELAELEFGGDAEDGNWGGGDADGPRSRPSKVEDPRMKEAVLAMASKVAWDEIPGGRNDDEGAAGSSEGDGGGSDGGGGRSLDSLRNKFEQKENQRQRRFKRVTSLSTAPASTSSNPNELADPRMQFTTEDLASVDLDAAAVPEPEPEQIQTPGPEQAPAPDLELPAPAPEAEAPTEDNAGAAAALADSTLMKRESMDELQAQIAAEMASMMPPADQPGNSAAPALPAPPAPPSGSQNTRTVKRNDSGPLKQQRSPLQMNRPTRPNALSTVSETTPPAPVELAVASAPEAAPKAAPVSDAAASASSRDDGPPPLDKLPVAAPIPLTAPAADHVGAESSPPMGKRRVSFNDSFLGPAQTPPPTAAAAAVDANANQDTYHLSESGESLAIVKRVSGILKKEASQSSNVGGATPEALDLDKFFDESSDEDGHRQQQEVFDHGGDDFTLPPLRASQDLSAVASTVASTHTDEPRAPEQEPASASPVSTPTEESQPAVDGTSAAGAAPSASGDVVSVSSDDNGPPPLDRLPAQETSGAPDGAAANPGEDKLPTREAILEPVPEAAAADPSDDEGPPPLEKLPAQEERARDDAPRVSDDEGPPPLDTLPVQERAVEATPEAAATDPSDDEGPPPLDKLPRQEDGSSPAAASAQPAAEAGAAEASGAEQQGYYGEDGIYYDANGQPAYDPNTAQGYYGEDGQYYDANGQPAYDPNAAQGYYGEDGVYYDATGQPAYDPNTAQGYYGEDGQYYDANGQPAYDPNAQQSY